MNEYCRIISDNKQLFSTLSIEFDENYIIKTLPFVFTEILNEELVKNFDKYLPFLNYSIISHLKNNVNKMKQIENIFEIVKIFQTEMKSS